MPGSPGLGAAEHVRHATARIPQGDLQQDVAGRSIESMARLLIAPAIFDERASLELFEGDTQLFLGVHHDGTVPGDGLADWLARDEKKPHLVCLGGDSDKNTD